MTKRLILVLILVLAVVTASFATTPTKATDIVAKLDPGIKVTLDGKLIELKSEEGQPVHVIIYNGTTYLPVRGLSSALGKDVKWDGPNRTVILTSKPTQDSAQTTTQPVQGTKFKQGDVVFKNDKVEVKYAGFALDEHNEFEYKFVVRNLTNNEYKMTTVDTKINGIAVAEKSTDDEDIEAKEVEDVEIEFKKATLDKAGIKEVKSLEFKFKFHHRTAPFETGVIIMNF